jgi:hypothetical protein
VPSRAALSHHAPSSHQRSNIGLHGVTSSDTFTQLFKHSNHVNRTPRHVFQASHSRQERQPSASFLQLDSSRPPPTRPPRPPAVRLSWQCPRPHSRLENKRLPVATCPVDLLGQHLQLLRTAKSHQGETDAGQDSAQRTRQGVSVACTADAACRCVNDGWGKNSIKSCNVLSKFAVQVELFLAYLFLAHEGPNPLCAVVVIAST